MNVRFHYQKFVFHYGLAVLGILGMAFIPVSSQARIVIPGYYDSYTSPTFATPSVNTLPILDQVIENAELQKTADNKLEINQTDEKAIIHWKSFDIGANAWTHFNQKGNTDWTALNRIYDQNPSQIYGRLSADGRVYLVNQNGILFGPGSQVNVHSLVGSALNIDDQDFKDSVLSFHLDNYTGQTYSGAVHPLEESCVANHGTIETIQGGQVFLMGPQVENSGKVSAPLGQAALAAGTEVELENEQDYNDTSIRVAKLVNVKEGAGTAENMGSGQIASDMGTAGMYGRIVNQNGLIQSVTAVEKDGNIELIASEKVFLGPGSYTVCPISSSTEKVHESFVFQGGDIKIHAHDKDKPQSNVVLPTKRIEVYGTVAAPSGNVRMEASERIYLESGSRVDVGGSIVGNSVEDGVIEAQLNSVEMKDDFGQKGGILQGEYISFTTQEGSSIGDVSAHLNSEEKTAGEFSTQGGEIYLTCKTGDIVIKENAGIDFSGGGIHYDSGYVETTKLLSGNKVYDISNAPQWINYDQILGSFKKTYDRFGIEEEYNGSYFGGSVPVKDYCSGFFQGDDAGRLVMVAPQIVLNGLLDGSAVAGVYQTEYSSSDDEDTTNATRIPEDGTLVIGELNEGADWRTRGADKVVSEIVIRKNAEPLSGLSAESEIPVLPSASDPLVYSDGTNVLQTIIGADIVNNADLGNIYLYTNTRLTIDPEASLSLSPKGVFSAVARQFQIDGQVAIPAGIVRFTADESYTASERLITGTDIFSDIAGWEVENLQYVDMAGGFALGGNSSISTAGERIDNTDTLIQNDQTLQKGQLDGGSIILEDSTDANFENGAMGLVMEEGACLDVSGGYQMDPGGKLAGGDAGEINIQAADMALDGDLFGYALEGYDGGTVLLRAKEISIVSGKNDIDPEASDEGMLLADDRFSDFGFTQLIFESKKDLTIENGVLLAPSLKKLAIPEQNQQQMENGSELSGNVQPTDNKKYAPEQLVKVAPEYLGDSSIQLSAALSFQSVISAENISAISSQVDVQPDAEIRMAPGGTIKLSATGIQMAGSLSAPAGSITIESKGDGKFDLVVAETGRILAPGFNRLDETSAIKGLPVSYTPLDGGKVTLKASDSSLVIAKGAEIDVSGSTPVSQPYTDADGTIHTRQVAGNSGGIELAFQKNLNLESGAVLSADSRMAGMQGGSLTIRKTDETERLIVASTDLTDDPAEELLPGNGAATAEEDSDNEPFTLDLEKFVTPESGFDALTIASAKSIEFQGSQKLKTTRKITLDAPLIFSTDDEPVELTSSWVVLSNTDFPDSGTLGSGLEKGDAVFNATADWIDLTGDIRFSGFGNETNSGVSLNAKNDIRLTDLYYTSEGGPILGWSGGLTTSGNLDLTAARIYPVTRDGIPSDYTLQSHGILATHSSGTILSDAVYSAGGSITLLADQINHEGVLLAPMGQILMAGSVTTELVDGEAIDTYEPADRIYLAPGSRVSTKGESSVLYGGFDSDGINWFYADKEAGEQYAQTEITQSPDSWIELKGDEVILRPESEIDASGGGGLFSYLFLPGIEGSTNPLEKRGQYVILPDNRIDLPGESVYLEGVEGLADGTYTLLPEEFAFMTDAIVIRSIGANLSQERNRFTEEGYQIAGGYMGNPEAGIQSPVVQDFSIRSAADVLTQGNFTTDRRICGNAGDVTIQGNTTIINGSISGSPLPADPASGYEGGEGGILTLSGREVRIGEAADDVDIIFSHEVEEQYENILSVGSDTLSQGDLGEVRIGDDVNTESITLSEGSSVTSRMVTLTARDKILLNDGSEIRAVGSEDEKGTATLVAGNQIKINGNARVTATDEVIIDTNELEMGSGSLEIGNSTLSLKSDTIYLASNDGYRGDGLTMTPAMWSRIIGADSIDLESRSDIVFQGDVTLSADQRLSLSASRLVGIDSDSVNLSSRIVILSGIDAEVSPATVDNTGTMTVQASEQMVIQNDGQGKGILIQGFSDIHLKSEKELTFRGEGVLETGDGNITLTAEKINTSYFQTEPETDGQDSDEQSVPAPDLLAYIPGNFSVDAGTGTIRLVAVENADVPETAEAADTGTPGGQLFFSGNSIEIGAPVDLPGGRLTCTSGNGGITLMEKAHINAAGIDSAPGGTVTLAARNSGGIQIADKAVIDVSAGSQGDAGSVSLSAPGGGVVLNGNLVAKASGGNGGSFVLDTKELSKISTITGKLEGFTRSLDFRSRAGNVAIDVDMTAQSVKVTADKGGIITLSSTITAHGDAEGGTVELNADGDVDLAAGSRIDARGAGTGHDGGTVFLNTANGDIQFREGARIDVSGNGEGMDGTVVFRAKRQGSDDVRMDLAGTITGASEIQAEAVDVKDNISTIDSSYISTLRTETQTYMDAVSAGTTVEDLLAGMTVQGRDSVNLSNEGKANLFRLVPGIEVLSPEDGDLTLEDAWTLTYASWRFNSLPGVITLRSAGDLTIEENMIDSPTSSVNLPGDSGTDSWGIRLVAGADFSTPDLMAIKPGAGVLSIEDYKKVYTESASLWFASGGDTWIGPVSNPYYALATYDGDIQGTVGHDLVLEGGVIQSATGDIRITVGNNLDIETGGSSNYLGAIRTTGRQPDPADVPEEYQSYVRQMYWDFYNGGDIDLSVACDVNGGISKTAWDRANLWFDEDGGLINVWSANYAGGNTTQGIATLGGGDVAVRCGGDYLGQIGTFGEGDLSIYAGGNLDGRFLVRNGTGRLNAMGSLGAQPNLNNQIIEIMDAEVWADAQGHIDLGSVINPSVAGSAMNQSLYRSEWDLTYVYEGQYKGAQNSAVHLQAHTGDVVLAGDSAFGDVLKDTITVYRLLPPVVSVSAGGDIYLQNNFVLAPSPTGNLTLQAGKDIYGQYAVGEQIQNSWVRMPDLDPALYFGRQTTNSKDAMMNILLGQTFAGSPKNSLHYDDSDSISIQAGGDIQNLKLFLSKKAEISAGSNIVDLYYEGQNVRSGDVTSIQAGNSILFTSEAFAITDKYKGIKHGGPGLLWISAQNEIDLGATDGIQTIGNLENRSLPTESSDAMVISGYSLDKEEAELRSFFASIQKAGTEYSNKLSEGDPEAANQVVETLRNTVIDPFFADSSGREVSAQKIDGRTALADESDDQKGNLNMVQSQISSAGNKGDIFVIAGGELNVGRTTFSDDDSDVKNSGIFTAGGGSIFAFAEGDVNVNEARMMTFYGGDITVWSEAGNINAGRGSKTAVSATPAAAIKKGDEYVVEFNPPAVGSGVRTLTFDPDGAAGAQVAPVAGDVYLFAPAGEIDAGEAGIAGSNVILGALTVVNVQNISFSQGAVGVPTSSEATATMGALTGGGALSEAGKMADANAAIQAANKQFEQDAKAMEKTFMPTWLRVQFMGFDIEDGEVSEEDES
ncbi:MAG: filamentous hemagglutinin family protein [Pseudomonadota bacterium]